MKMVNYVGSALVLIVAVWCGCQSGRVSRIELEIGRVKDSRGVAIPISYGKRYEYGKYRLLDVRSLYAKDGERWLPVYCVDEVTTNVIPPFRFIDRTGMWYAPAGDVDLGKLRDEYVPPRPLWEVP